MDSPLSMPFTIFDDSPAIPCQWDADVLRRFVSAWTVTLQGTCVHVVRKASRGNDLGCNGRKEIGTFTWGARSRMLRFMNQVNWENLHEVLFVTLTYPDEVSECEYEERSKHRYLLHRYVEKYLCEKIPMVWRVEWKERKSGARKGRLAPHWHLLLLTRKFLPHELVREWWRKAIQYEGRNLATDVRRVSGIDGAIRYVAKYTAKACSLDIITYHNNGAQKGRHWGILRKGMIPMAPKLTYTSLDLDQIKELQAYARSRNEKYDEYGAAGFTALGRDCVKIVKEILK